MQPGRGTDVSADWLLDQARDQHPSYRITAEGGGFRARRDGRQWPASGPPARSPLVLSNILDNQRHEDAREAALGERRKFLP
jgi:hypothetical protein